MLRILKSIKIISLHKRIKLKTAKLITSIFNLLSSGIVLLLDLLKKIRGKYIYIKDVIKNKIKQILPNSYKSNLISYFLRPVFEHKRIRVVFGVSLIVFIVVSEMVNSSVSAAFVSIEDMDIEDEEVSVVQKPKEVIDTEETYQMPFDTLGVSQDFTSYHPGVDLRAAYGTEIRPINNGVVVDVYRSLYGYGQAIIIEHAVGYSSLYAHVTQITVEKGFNVDKNTVIANVGLTGYTTGPHLHLEIHKEGNAINPKPILSY